MAYNWQLPTWPQFSYDLTKVEDSLFDFAEQTGQANGIINTLPETLREEAIINILVSEAIKTSEIEGEYFSRQDIVSSIRNNLGLNENHELVKNNMARGVSEMMVAVRKTYAEELTEETLFNWHTMLLGESRRINAGAWRKHEDPMQVISGSIGKEKIHFEAPPSSSVPGEMKKFIQWFNDSAPGGVNAIKKAPVRSAIAHLYFESIHPFEDGNGRIGRAIAEKALSQTVGRPILLSLSKAIESKKSVYYNVLEQAQQANEITPWVSYFVETILEAQAQAKQLIDLILKKSRFFNRFKEVFMSGS